MLWKDWPPHATILSLVRDAASKLPDGVGTRADVCLLLKDSQYLEPLISDLNLNQVVSGALDRLHYEYDPCVMYDTDKKIWIYLHKGRNIKDAIWVGEGPLEDSAKKGLYFQTLDWIESVEKE